MVGMGRNLIDTTEITPSGRVAAIVSLPIRRVYCRVPSVSAAARNQLACRRDRDVSRSLDGDRSASATTGVQPRNLNISHMLHVSARRRNRRMRIFPSTARLDGRIDCDDRKPGLG